MATANFQVFGLPHLPMVRAGDDLAELIAGAIERSEHELANSDIVCVAQKIVSKAEGRLIALATITAIQHLDGDPPEGLVAAFVKIADGAFAKAEGLIKGL